MKDAQKKYEEWEKTFTLPARAVFERCFGSINTDVQTLRDLAEQCVGNIKESIDYIEGMFQPDHSLISMSEASSLTPAKKQYHYETFKRLLYVHRYATSILFTDDEGEMACSIKEITDEWVALRPKIRIILTDMRDSWNASKQESDEENYFG